MKKCLSLLCALSLMLSANAVQQTPAKMAVAELNGKVLNKTAKAPKMIQSTATNARKAAMAPKATAETIDLTFDNSSDPSFEYYAADGDWYLGWIDVTSTYIVRFDYVVGFEGQFGTYTIADLDLDYSYFTDYSSGSRVDLVYTDAQFTITDEGNGSWSLSGYVVCENGNTYNLSGYYEASQGETYDVELATLVSAFFYDFDSDWYFKVANAEYSFTLDLVSMSGMFAGEYTTEDALLNYCSVNTLTGDEKVESLEISIVTTDTAGSGVLPASFELTGVIVTSKGNTYNIHLVVTAPLTPKQVINVNVECVDFEWPTCDYPGVAGMFIFADTDVPSRAFQIGVANPAGEFTVGDGILKEYTGMVDYSTLMPYMIDNGIVTVSLDIERYLVIVEAEMVCADTIQYNFTCEIPVEFAGETTQTFDSLSIDDTLAGMGVYFFNAENEDAAISGNFATENFDDHNFSGSDIALTITTAESGEVNSLIIISARIYNDGANLDIVFLGEDMVLYTINASGSAMSVDNVKTTLEAKKMIKNGMLVIEKNGIEYNVLGAQL